MLLPIHSAYRYHPSLPVLTSAADYACWSPQGLSALSAKRRTSAFVVGGMKRTNPTIIVSIGDIQRPMQGVFNPPVLSNCRRNSRAGWRQTAEVELRNVPLPSMAIT